MLQLFCDHPANFSNIIGANLLNTMQNTTTLVLDLINTTQLARNRFWLSDLYYLNVEYYLISE